MADSPTPVSGDPIEAAFNDFLREQDRAHPHRTEISAKDLRDAFRAGAEFMRAEAAKVAQKLASSARSTPALLPFECDDLEIAAVAADVIARGIERIGTSAPARGEGERRED